jgi:carbon storage regulator
MLPTYSQNSVKEENQMLIVTRRINEAIVVGSDPDIASIIAKEVHAIVTILGVKGNQVRVGVLADKRIPVHRAEVWETRQEEAKRKDATNRK